MLSSLPKRRWVAKKRLVEHTISAGGAGGELIDKKQRRLLCVRHTRQHMADALQTYAMGGQSRSIVGAVTSKMDKIMLNCSIYGGLNAHL